MKGALSAWSLSVRGLIHRACAGCASCHASCPSPIHHGDRGTSRARRGTSRPSDGRPSAPLMSAWMSVDSARLLVIGVISAPEYRTRRDAIRRTWLTDLPQRVTAQFVVRAGECGGLTARSDTSEEAKSHNDMIRVHSICARERRDRGAVLTLYAWLRYAATHHATAAFVAKLDDVS